MITATSALMNLAAIEAPLGLTLIPGGTYGVELPFSLPPLISLQADHRSEILDMMSYAGIRYRSSESAAAEKGAGVFRIARDFARTGPFERVTFDWDHTLGNYQIFEDVWGVIRTRARRMPPDEELAARPMVALEVARPFMYELAFGMMVGFALRQGLTRFDQWERYEPRVGLATHTWPDRLGILASYFFPLLPLMEGLLPGSPGMRRKMTDGSARAIIHLHHFLDYADRLMTRIETGGLAGMTSRERQEAAAYFEDGKGHYRKPLGALALHGWATSSLLHFDDSTTVVSDVNALPEEFHCRAIHVRQPHSRLFKDVQEWHKISLPALWRSREAAALGIAGHLARLEDHGSTIDAIIGALRLFSGEAPSPSDLPVASHLPEGVILTVHETPTTLREFWRHYVEPTNRVKEKIRRIRKGMTAHSSP